MKILPNLRALHVGSTKIKGSIIADITKELKFLRKLSVKGLGGNDNPSCRGTMNTKQMMQIGNNVSHLTHLDISGCQQVTNVIFENFQNLKFVNLWMASEITKEQKM